MDCRSLGKSGLKVPVLSFGGSGPLFSNWGQSDATEARRRAKIRALGRWSGIRSAGGG